MSNSRTTNGRAIRAACVVGALLALATGAQAGWIAYNDFAGTAAANNSKITANSGTVTGDLLNIDDGTDTGANLTLTYDAGHTGGEYATTGSLSVAGTDAYDTFSGYANAVGILDMANNRLALTLTLSGLNPGARYEVALFTNRSGLGGRIATATISDVSSFANASTTGATISTTTLPNDTTGISVDNYTTGYVHRYTDISPGADGDIAIALTNNAGANWNLMRIEELSTLISWTGGDANWGDPGNWDLATVPDATMIAQVANTGTANVIDSRVASGLTVDNSSTVAVASGAALTIGSTVDVTADGTLTVAAGGALVAEALNSAGTTTLGSGASGSIATLNVTGGTTGLGASTVDAVNVSGGALNVQAGISAESVTVTGGTTTLTGGNLTVDALDVSAPGAGVVNTGAYQVRITAGNSFVSDGTTFSNASHSFGLQGANLADASADRTVALAGGTLTVTHPGSAGGFVPLANITATAENEQYAPISNTVAWVGMDRGTQAAPDKDALQNNNYLHKWTPGANALYWGKWHLDSVNNDAFTLDNIFWWQYNQGGTTRGIARAELYYSNATDDPGNPKDNPGNWTLFYDNNVGDAWPIAPGTTGDHTVVDLTLDTPITARWISILPTELGGSNPLGGMGSILFTQAPEASAIDLPATGLAVTAPSTLALITAEAVTLGDLTADLALLAPGQTLLTLNSDATGISFGDLYVTSAAASGSYTLLDWSDKPVGSAGFGEDMFGNVTLDLGGYVGALSYSDTQVLLDVTLIPEPATVSLLALGAVAALVRRRRR